MNNDITLMVDSGSDFEPHLAGYLNYPIRVIPLHLFIEGKEYLDGVDITKTNFYKEMETASELPKTSQPTPHNFYEIFSEELFKGRKVFYIGISSKLSGTIQSAYLAKQMLTKEEQQNIYIVDSLNASAAILHVLFKANSLLTSGMSIEDTIKELEVYRTKVKLFALLDTLENLKKGGRVSFAQAAIGGLLNIKPLITVEDGLVESVEKFRGRKKGIKSLSDMVNNQDQKIDYNKIFVAHSYPDEEKLKEDIKELNLGSFKEVIHLKLGTTIGTHVGTNTIGVVYVEE